MAGSYRHGVRRRFIVVAWAFAVFVASLLVATPALADDYSIDAVNIDAAVSSNGTLSVTETREFVFDGSFHGVYWKIPKGENSSNGKNVDITINYVGLLVNGQVQKFDLSNSGGNSTYQVSDEGSYYQVKLYSAQEDDTAQFVISYDATGIVTRWDDTGELYWKFVSDGWDVESQNVTCTVTLPVPAGETVTPGDNVRAWGHGPLDASVAFNGNTIVYTVPGVGSDEYAESRITFPTSWISGCEATSGSELSTILTEEQQWADEANAKREAARMAIIVSLIVAAAAVALSILLIIRIRKNYRRTHTPLFQDKYFRDVPTADHPAVLGALHRDGKADVDDFTATLMLPDDRCLVAEVAGQVVGAVWCRTADQYGHIDDETPSLSIALYPEFRGRGIGTALMRAMLVHLTEAGYARVSLSVQQENYARRLYESLGFTTVGETGGELVMACQLERHIGLCGDDCSACPRRLARDDDELGRVAELWVRLGWRDEVETPAALRCKGCSSEGTNCGRDGRCVFGLWECVAAHSVGSCHECAEWPWHRTRLT